MPVRRFADIKQRADVGVLQRGYRSRFALEPLLRLSRDATVDGQQFDRDVSSESGVARFVDLPHAASP
jgi:hypothetical protein